MDIMNAKIITNGIKDLIKYSRYSLLVITRVSINRNDNNIIVLTTSLKTEKYILFEKRNENTRINARMMIKE